MVLWAVEPLEGCQRPLLDAETPFLYVPVGQERVRREGGRVLQSSSGELAWLAAKRWM